MAVPFRKKTSIRVKKGRGTRNFKFLKLMKNLSLTLSECNQCKKMKRSHYQCLNCSS